MGQTKNMSRSLWPSLAYVWRVPGVPGIVAIRNSSSISWSKMCNSSILCRFFSSCDVSDRPYVWYIYLHLGWFLGLIRWIFHAVFGIWVYVLRHFVFFAKSDTNFFFFSTVDIHRCGNFLACVKTWMIELHTKNMGDDPRCSMVLEYFTKLVKKTLDIFEAQ